ncbi:glycosyltransferase family 2 protein [Thiocapsa sp. N5-Cardenillas]|uniref:glycosyltransferase family 2 protein n=1 Tax=Thiocapsa sp. N5-Cardenillas TaxID=3137397 RepID=UPI0035B2FEE3
MDAEPAEVGVEQENSEYLSPHSVLFNGAKAIVCTPIWSEMDACCYETLTICMSRFSRSQVKWMGHTKTNVYEARNRLATRFLRTDAEWMIFIDGDMALPCGDAAFFKAHFKRPDLPDSCCSMNAIERIISWPSHALVAGASYMDRIFGTQMQNSLGTGSHKQTGASERWKNGGYGGLQEILWVATGCMRIHRSVFQTLWDNRARFPEIVPAKEGGIVGFFHPQKVGVGEDVSFCNRVRACGIKVYWDAGMRLLHHGEYYF